MARIRPVPRDEAHPDAQRVYDAQIETWGFVLNPAQVLAHKPAILLASQRLYRAISAESLLPAGLQSLVCVRIAATVGCPF
jgi:alkylhydroperoxidase family enzyme